MTIREKVLRAYELLATEWIENHLDGLNLLEEARKEDPRAVMLVEQEIDQYKTLEIIANDPNTYIYLDDTEGNLVQREKGAMLTSVAPGKYDIYFGKSKEPKRIDLTKDMTVHE